MHSENVERRSHTFDGKRYEIILPDVISASNLNTETIGCFGALVGGLGAALPILTGLQTGSGATAALEAFASLLQKTDSQRVNEIFREAVGLGKLSCDGREIHEKSQYLLHFGQVENRKALYPVSAWALWECVRDFFPAWGALLSKIGNTSGRWGKESPSPKDGQKTTG